MKIYFRTKFRFIFPGCSVLKPAPIPYHRGYLAVVPLLNDAPLPRSAQRFGAFLANDLLLRKRKLLTLILLIPPLRKLTPGLFHREVLLKSVCVPLLGPS